MITRPECKKNGAFRVRRRRFSIKGRCGSGRGGPAAVPEVKQQDGADERNDGGRNREDPVAARQARDHVAQAGGERHREAVGHLGRDVLDVVASRACRRENRRVRNGRAVVAEDGARERGGERDDGEARIDGLDNRHHDRDQDAKRAPGRARREGQEGGDHEDHGRQEDRPLGAARGHDGLHEERGLEKVAVKRK